MRNLLDRPARGIVLGGESGDPVRSMARRGRWVVLAAGVTVVIAVLALAGGASPGPAAGHVLVTDDAGTVSLIDTTEATTLYSIEDAVAAPDATTIYRTAPADGSTRLDELDSTDGSLIGSQIVPGDVAVAVVAHDASAAALLPKEVAGGGLYAPVPRETTRIVVARNDGSEPRTYDLAGNFEPEAFSRDLDTLFLIEFWPAIDPDRYFVRQLGLTDGEIRVAYSPEVEWAPEMRGRARAHTMDPTGSFLYTLYSVQPGDVPITDPQDGSEHRAFVHVIDLHEERSICIFLGDEFAADSGDRLGMALTPDGGKLYVADSFTGDVVTIDARGHRVEEVTRVEKLVAPPGEGAPPAMAAADDMLYVTRGTALILGLDRHAGLEPVRAIGMNQAGYAIDGLALSPDGSELRIATRGEVVVYDLASDSEKSRVLAPAGHRVYFAGVPRGIASRYPIECAC